jgi:hypothetical protein
LDGVLTDFEDACLAEDFFAGDLMADFFAGDLAAGFDAAFFARLRVVAVLERADAIVSHSI